MGYGNYEWFMKQDLSSYANQWVVIIDKKVVANGKDIKKIVNSVKKEFPNKVPFVTKINNKVSIL